MYVDILMYMHIIQEHTLTHTKEERNRESEQVCLCVFVSELLRNPKL